MWITAENHHQKKIKLKFGSCPQGEEKNINYQEHKKHFIKKITKFQDKYYIEKGEGPKSVEGETQYTKDNYCYSNFED